MIAFIPMRSTMPLKSAFLADRQLDRHGVGAEPLDHGLDGRRKSAPTRSILLT